MNGRSTRRKPLGRPATALAVLLLLSCAVTAVRSSEEPAAPAEPSPKSEPASDTRDPALPAGAMRGYIDACRSGDYATAAQFLDLREIDAARRAESGPRLARQLKFVLDQKLWIDFTRLSQEPSGNLDDGLPPNVERIGTIADGIDVEIYLVRLPVDGKLQWKFAPAVVARIPDLYDRFGYGRLGELLPRSWIETTFAEIRVVQWLGLALLLVLGYFLSWFAVRLIQALLRPVVARTETELDDVLLAKIDWPVRFLIGLALFFVGTLPLRLAQPVHEFLVGLGRGLVLFGLAWMALRVVDIAAALIEERLERSARPTARAVVPLGRRAVKVVLLIVAVVGVLQNVGFNVTGLIAGLGVGGLAFALAAQKSIENLFGGVTLIVDQPVRVGDFCRFGDGQVGTVEAIGLRSTRIRTLDRTLVSVPNSQFSEFRLENFAERDRIRLVTVLGLRYETSPDQLRYVLAGLREVLIGHPRVADEPLRVRFIQFGAHSLDLEVYAMVETTDFNEFCAIREDLFLRFMDVVEQAGSGFAFPSQTLYLGRDGGLDGERRDAALRAVAGWRESGALPFPDFSPERKAELRRALRYPPEGSSAPAP